MFVEVLRSKIHNATVTSCNLDYEGSISIDQNFIDAAGLLPHEKVLVVNVTNGERFETYVIPAPAGSGEIGLNGAAARLAVTGDKLIIMAFAWKQPQEFFQTTIVLMGEGNHISEIKRQAS